MISIGDRSGTPYTVLVMKRGAVELSCDMSPEEALSIGAALMRRADQMQALLMAPTKGMH